jgi:Tfp pilus assembly protein PilO
MKSPIQFNSKTFFALSGLTFLVGGGLAFMSFSSKSETEGHIETLRKDMRDEKQVLTELADSEKAVVTLENQLVHLEQGVPQFAYIPTLLSELEKSGNENNVAILQVQPIITQNNDAKSSKEKDKASAYTQQTISIKGRGSYSDSLRFIQSLNTFPKIVAVRTISMLPRMDAKKDEKAKGLVLDLDIEIRAYLFKDRTREIKARVKLKNQANPEAGADGETQLEPLKSNVSRDPATGKATVTDSTKEIS